MKRKRESRRGGGSGCDLRFCRFCGSGEAAAPANQRRPERNDLSRSWRTSNHCIPSPHDNLRSSYHLSYLNSRIHFCQSAMASTKPVARLVAYRRPSPYLLTSSLRPVGSTANFSSSVSRAATPYGPPQPGFRLPAPKRWDQGAETSVDKASKYFLLAEMFRGMYVVLEQFFRPP